MGKANVVASPEMQKYFDNLNSEINKAYDIATKARQKGYDPETKVAMPLAANAAERVEALISSIAPQIVGSGVAERISELEKKYDAGDWRISLMIAGEVAQEKFCKFKDKLEAITVGSKLGFAYLTGGVVAAPLEGLLYLKFKKRKDGKDYLALYYSGPIRGAGGTAAAISIIIADYVRRLLGIADYDPQENEIRRYQVEIDDYLTKVAHRQYVPSAEEIRLMITSMKVEVTGDPTERYEVSQFKRLDRVETPLIRGGMCLVMTEGPSLKSPKLWKNLKKWKDDFGLSDWAWLEEFVALKEKLHTTKQQDQTSDEKIKPDNNFLRDIVAGRPVFTYPMEPGGFRLRYGRTRLSGYGSMCVSPATMQVLNKYVATGTQIKLERPGKGTVISPCDSIEGPIIKLTDGSVKKIRTEEDGIKFRKNTEEIIFLGDYLASYGEFAENGQRLPPAGYCPEWYAVELEKVAKKVNNIAKEVIDNPVTHKISFDDAINLSKEYGVSLHPDFIYFWKEITAEQLKILRDWLLNMDESLVIAGNEAAKRTLELIGCEHDVKDGVVLLSDLDKAKLKLQLNFSKNWPNKETSLENINELCEFTIRDLSGTCIGGRMGRPEKAKMRKMTGSPQSSFPVGTQGGRLRSLQSALEVGYIKSNFPLFYCDNCNKQTIYSRCEDCDGITTLWRLCSVCKKKTQEEECHDRPTICYQTQTIDIQKYVNSARRILDMRQIPPLVKGVRGTWNKDHLVEHLTKGLLRAKHNLYVNKDGTIRYDMTEMGVTHFKPSEIKTSVNKLKSMGYLKDIYGKALEDEDQILEIKPQDVILPSCPEAPEDGSDEILFRVGNFVDELLSKLYKLEPFYNYKSKKDVIGSLIIGLAPHTSAGIVGRVIGFSETQGCFAHPYWHDAMRRDLDGDETAIILVMDAFLNFSRQYLPDRIGGRSMDSPLVLTTILNPEEIDEEVYDVDVGWKYPLELYEAALDCKWPWDIKIEQIKHRVGKPEQYEGMGYTHPTTSINSGIRYSAYKELPTMVEKMDGQIDLAKKIRAVSLSGVTTLIIERHLLRDIKGNLRKYTMQGFRCIACNEKYRRPPFSGVCTKCGGKLVFTISEGTVKKYLEPSLKIAGYGSVSPYLQQTLDIIQRRIESIFGKEKTKQIGLQGFFEEEVK